MRAHWYAESYRVKGRMQDSHKPEPSTKFLYLEGLRGALAVVVCLGHYGVNTVLRPYGLLVNFGLAVDVFFVMSGFVLSYAYFFSNRSWAEFIVGRFARLYPLHLITLIFACVVARSWQVENIGAVFVQNLFLVQNIGLIPHDPGPNYPNWSISVELWVAIFYFLGMRVARKLIPLFFLFVMVPVVLLLTDFPNSYHYNYFYFVNGGVLRGLIGFAVGVGSFLLYRQVRGHNVAPWACTALLVPFVLLFFADKSNASNLLFLYAGSFVLMIALALRRVSHGWFANLLAFSGAISYSIYLLHVPLYLLMERMLGEPHVPGAAAIWSLPILLVVAPVSAYLFERPIQNWLLSFVRRKLPFREDSRA